MTIVNEVREELIKEIKSKIELKESNVRYYEKEVLKETFKIDQLQKQLLELEKGNK